MSIDPAVNHAMTLEDRVAQLEARHERTIRPGYVPQEGGIDVSDPTKPRFRIVHGQNKDGTPALGPWLPMMMHAGEMNRWTPPSPGMQMVQFAPDGVFENGVLIPFTHSQNVPAPSTDVDRHVSQFGDHREDVGKQDHTRTIGTTSDHQDMNDKRVNVGGKIEHTAGDPSAAESTGAPAAGALMPHELNRLLQSIVARLGQHDHFLTALHGEASTMVDKLVGLCPALIDQQQLTLNHRPDGLQKAADNVVGVLPSFMGQSLLQSVAKLATTFLGGVMEAVQGNTAAQLSGLIAQAGQALAGAGLSGGAAATAAMYLAQAQATAGAAASGAPFELAAQLAGLTNLAAGTPAAGPLAGIVGQLQGVMGSTGGLMSGLSGLLDSQDNAAKGTIKSMLLGGY